MGFHGFASLTGVLIADASRTLADRKNWLWLLVAAFVFINPVGYVGGGADDDRYLAGALCWLQQGPCLPVNHWEGRWPLIGSLALSLELFGFNRVGLAFPALLASLVCLILLKLLGDRLFGRPVGQVAALIFGAVPVFAIQALSATVEPFELAFILAGFFLIISERPLLAGLAFAMAFQVRETSIAALLPAAFLLRKDWRSVGLLAMGFGIPLLMEFLLFQLVTGDPLYRRVLSVRHSLLPSSELSAVATGPPFFNVALLKHWKYEPGIDLHWLFNGFANLFVNLKTGLLLVVAPLFALLYRHKLSESERRAVAFLIASSFLYAAILIYVLAIDPKPRMMYIPLAGLALAVGLVAVRAWNLVLKVAFVSIAVLAALVLTAQPRQSHWQRIAEQMISRHPEQVETAQPNYFAFSPSLLQLPPIGSGRPMLLLVKSRACVEPSNEDPFALSYLKLVSEGRGEPLARALDYPWSVCLFHYVRPPPNVIVDPGIGPFHRRTH